MKYALVLIPLRDDRNLDDLQVDYQVLEKDGDDYFESCVAEDTAAPLIPLPEKLEYIDENKDYSFENDYCFSEEEFNDIITNNQASGWNKCVDEILGEE